IFIMRLVQLLLIAGIAVLSWSTTKAQYVQKERDDTIRLYAKTPFDSLQAKTALARGTSSITGVAFTKPKNDWGFKAPLAQRIYAQHIKILLFPVNDYLLE